MKITGIGGLNYDIHIKTEDTPKPYDSNPARLYSSAGGVTRNILDNLSRLGLSCVLLSAVGHDSFADALKTECEDADIDISRLFEDPLLPTSTYVSMLDPTGEMFVAANDMRIHDQIPLSYYRENADVIRSSDAVVIDSNLTDAQLTTVLELAEGIPVFADPVSAAKAGRLLPYLSRLRFAKPNALELSALTGMDCSDERFIPAAAESLLDQGLSSIAVSLGMKGCYYADRNGLSFFRSLECSLPVMNVSGSGDAFCAGFICASLNGADPESAVDFALACGKITTLSEDTVDPCITQEYVFRFLDKYRKD